MANIDHRTLRRRGFDLHIAALLRLRREHGHHSFFDERGHVRGYATAYLQRWLASEWPADQAAGIPNLHKDDFGMVSLETVLSLTTQESIQLATAHAFLEILHILESEETAFYDDTDGDDARAAQMDELSRAYTVVDHPNWTRCDDEENVVYLR